MAAEMADRNGKLREELVNVFEKLRLRLRKGLIEMQNRGRRPPTLATARAGGSF